MWRRCLLAMGEAEVTSIASFTAVRVYVKELMQQKLQKADSSGTAEGGAATVGTNSGTQLRKHGTTTLSGLDKKYTPAGDGRGKPKIE